MPARRPARSMPCRDLGTPILFLLPAALARAQTGAAGCEATPAGLACRLGSVLHILYALAALLGVLLGVVLWLTLRAYRRKAAEKDLLR